MEKAAEVMGIPMDEALEWAQGAVEAREPVRGAAGHAALLDAIGELREALKTEDTPETPSEDGMPPRPRGRPAAEVRLMAAIALGRMGLQLAKLERAAATENKKAASAGQRDLFDAAEPDPWAD